MVDGSVCSSHVSRPGSEYVIVMAHGIRSCRPQVDARLSDIVSSGFVAHMATTEARADVKQILSGSRLTCLVEVLAAVTTSFWFRQKKLAQMPNEFF